MRKSTHVQALRWLGLCPAVIVLALAALSLGPGIARAHQDSDALPRGQRMLRSVSIEMQNTTLGQVLAVMMKQAHVSYTLDARLTDDQIGAIRLENVPTRVAIETALKAGTKPATYRIENEIFMVIPEEEEHGPIASAQQPEVNATVAPGPPDMVQLEADNADLYTVLKLVFSHVHAQYTIDPALRNITVTVHVQQPLRQALETILRATGRPITYTVENDVYSIVPKATEQASNETSAAFPGGEGAEPVIKLDVTQGNLYDALKLLFSQVNAQYTLDPALQKITVTAHINQPFHVALEALLRAAGAANPLTYRVENNVYSIFPKEASP